MTTPTPTPSGLQNASSGFASNFNSTGPLLAIITIIIAVIIVLAFSTRAYRWALHSASVFASSVEYAIKGVATAIMLAIFTAPLYAASQATPAQRQLVFKGVALVVGGYVALVGLGIAGDYIWQLLSKRHEAATGHAPFENWGTETDSE